MTTTTPKLCQPTLLNIEAESRRLKVFRPSPEALFEAIRLGWCISVKTSQETLWVIVAIKNAGLITGRVVTVPIHSATHGVYFGDAIQLGAENIAEIRDF
jgi:hypothetical protein